MKIHKIVEYSYVKRLLGKVNCEGEDVIRQEFDTCLSTLSPEETNALQRSINSINVDLMKNHRYLMMISGSPVRSSGYGTPSHLLTKQTCIVLYVLAKHYIPIQEDPFEQHYNGIPVDVREGLFQLYAGRACDYHDNVKHGCQIERHLKGTLGGFITYGGVTYGVTCAHVLLSPEEMKSLDTSAVELYTHSSSTVATLDDTVYQPHRGEGNALGKGGKPVLKPGGRGVSGVDVVIFPIETRHPVGGDFPDRSDGTPSDLCYKSGKTVNSFRQSDRTVIKFGAATDITYGYVFFDVNMTSVKTFDINGQYQITLHNLLEIRSLPGQGAFADRGDSGAFVFCIGKNNDLLCIGMIEGGSSSNTCAVIPINIILQEFAVVKCKGFQEDEVPQRLETLENRMNAVEARILNSEQNLQQSISNSEQTLQQWLEARISVSEQNLNQSHAQIMTVLHHLFPEVCEQVQNQSNTSKTQEPC